MSDQTDSLKNFEASAENFGYVLENVDDYSLLHYKLYFIVSCNNCNCNYIIIH